MATIKISNLHPTGAELFSDSESYMNEMNNLEQSNIIGGDSGLVCDLSVFGFTAISGLRCGISAISLAAFLYSAPPAH